MMKTAILAVVAAVILGPGCAEQGASGSGGTWRTDYAGALADAKAAGKPVLLDFHADW